MKQTISLSGTAAMSKREILQILREYKEANSEKYGIQALGIFGSVARDENTEKSDLDVVVELDVADPFIRLKIQEELEYRTNLKVDVIRKRERMNQYLKSQISRDALYV